MSKREIRAKRLVAAVLLAISVQMWSAPAAVGGGSVSADGNVGGWGSKRNKGRKSSGQRNRR